MEVFCSGRDGPLAQNIELGCSSSRFHPPALQFEGRWNRLALLTVNALAADFDQVLNATTKGCVLSDYPFLVRTFAMIGPCTV